jgi:hypothetical protein
MRKFFKEHKITEIKTDSGFAPNRMLFYGGEFEAQIVKF